MPRYEKKNKSDSQKCIRLPLSFFSLISFMGCIYMAEELLNWLSLLAAELCFFTLHSSFFIFYTSFNTVSNLPMKSSTFSLVNTNGGRIRRMLVPAQPVKQCCSWMSLLRTSL